MSHGADTEMLGLTDATAGTGLALAETTMSSEVTGPALALSNSLNSFEVDSDVGTATDEVHPRPALDSSDTAASSQSVSKADPTPAAACSTKVVTETDESVVNLAAPMSQVTGPALALSNSLNSSQVDSEVGTAADEVHPHLDSYGAPIPMCLDFVFDISPHASSADSHTVASSQSVSKADPTPVAARSAEVVTETGPTADVGAASSTPVVTLAIPLAATATEATGRAGVGSSGGDDGGGGTRGRRDGGGGAGAGSSARNGGGRGGAGGHTGISPEWLATWRPGQKNSWPTTLSVVRI